MGSLRGLWGAIGLLTERKTSELGRYIAKHSFSIPGTTYETIRCFINPKPPTLVSGRRDEVRISVEAQKMEPGNKVVCATSTSS